MVKGFFERRRGRQVSRGAKGVGDGIRLERCRAGWSACASGIAMKAGQVVCDRVLENATTKRTQSSRSGTAACASGHEMRRCLRTSANDDGIERIRTLQVDTRGSRVRPLVSWGAWP